MQILGLARLAVLILALAFCLALAPESALANHVQCGDVITADTTLDSDLTCAGDGLTIAASDVTLSLGGHTIAGTGTRLSRGLVIHTVFPQPSELEGIAVVDGVVRGFYYGAEVDGPRATVFRELVLERNHIGIRCHYAPGCRVSDSTFRANDTGVSFEAVDAGCRPRALIARNLIEANERGIRIAGCGTDVVRNRIKDNASRGVEVTDHTLTLIADNVIAGNGAEGVYAWYLATVDVNDNRILRNGGHGVHFDGGTGPYAPGGVVRRNRVVRNDGDGIRTTQVWDQNTMIESNRVERNGDDGIDVDISEFGSPITVRSNRAVFNVDLGIEVDPGTIDGGGNRAAQNGNPAQCVGIVCR